MEIVLEQQLDLCGIRSHAAQNGSGLEGPLTGADIEELRIQADTGHQALGLDGQDVPALHGIAHQLRHKLRGRGGIGLVKVNHNRIDVVRSPTVVVYNADLRDGLQQGLELHLIRAVGIHHDQDALVVAVQQRVLSGNEHIPVLRHVPQLVQKPRAGVVIHIDDNARLLALLAAQAIDSNRRAKGIQVCIPVTHDKYMVTLGNELHDGIGRYPGPDLAAVLSLFAAAAIEIKIEPVLDNRLVTAPAQGHFYAQSGKAVALFKVGPVYTQANGNGSRQAGGALNFVDVLQQGEFVCLCPVQIPFFKDEQESVPLQPTQQAPVVLRPLCNGLIQTCIELGNGTFRQVLGHFLIVIDQNNGNHRAGADVFIPHLVHLRQIAEVQHPKAASGPPQDASVYPVAAALQSHILGSLVFSTV